MFKKIIPIVAILFIVALALSNYFKPEEAKVQEKESILLVSE